MPHFKMCYNISLLGKNKEPTHFYNIMKFLCKDNLSFHQLNVTMLGP
jgi:hypothetical protein